MESIMNIFSSINPENPTPCIEECCWSCLAVIQLSFLNSLITPIKNTVHSRQLCSGITSWKVGGSNKELVKDVWRGFEVIYCSLMDWTSNWTWIPNLKLLFSVNDIQSSSNKVFWWDKLMKNNRKFGLDWASWPHCKWMQGFTGKVHSILVKMIGKHYTEGNHNEITGKIFNWYG